MQLTQFADYSLRLCLYLSSHRDRTVPVEEIARAYTISRHHLVKIVQRLVELGYVDSSRGRGGGMRLAKEPGEINVGRLVRETEPTLDIVECFNAETNTCPIIQVCGLKGALERARDAFLKVLDRHTLADFGPQVPHLIQAWEIRLKESPKK